MRQTGKILLVDDDDFFLTVTEDLLKEAGYQVTAVPDPVKALNIAESEPHDLILLDVVLPRMDGLEMLQVLKQSPLTTHVPVLLLTIEHRENILVSGLRRGADDVLFKPIQTEELLARIDLALRRKKQLDVMRTVIRRHLDPSIARQVLDKPAPARQLIRTHLSVLFVDLRGFTKVVEAISPDRAADLLNSLFEELVGCVVKQGGTLDKFLGDGLMALFGTPVEYPDNETRAVRAAKDMIRSATQIGLKLSELVDRPVDVGVGICAGEVVVGPIGSRFGSSLTAIGRPVNTAARLTALARGNEIIISKSVADHLDPELTIEKLPPAQLKGKRDLLEIYRVVPDQDSENSAG